MKIQERGFESNKNIMNDTSIVDRYHHIFFSSHRMCSTTCTPSCELCTLEDNAVAVCYSLSVTVKVFLWAGGSVDKGEAIQVCFRAM